MGIFNFSNLQNYEYFLDLTEDFTDLTVVWLVILITLNDFLKNVSKKMSKSNIIIGAAEEYTGILHHNTNHTSYLIFSIKLLL